MAAGNEWPEVIHAGFDFPAGVNPRKPLPAVDLHEREQPERAHLAVGFWELVLSFAIEDVKCFESRIGLDELNTARDLAQIQIAHALGSLAVVACESLEEVTRFIENDQFSMKIEDFINAVMLRQCGQRSIVFDRLESELHV